MPDLQHACGLATVQMFADDLAGSSLLPVDGHLPVGPVEVDQSALARLAAAPERRSHWESRLALVAPQVPDVGQDLLS